jgi:hypothetical protein
MAKTPLEYILVFMYNIYVNAFIGHKEVKPHEFRNPALSVL